MAFLIMGICTVLFEKLYATLRSKELRRQDITNFSFKMFKIMRPLRSLKYLKTVELIFITQKANAWRPWTVCFVFNWKYLFWLKLVQKLKVISLTSNFIHILIQICGVPLSCSLFLFSTGNTFWANLSHKIKIVSLSWNFAVDKFEYGELFRQYVVFSFSVLDQKKGFWANLEKKSKLSV